MLQEGRIVFKRRNDIILEVWQKDAKVFENKEDYGRYVLYSIEIDKVKDDEWHEKYKVRLYDYYNSKDEFNVLFLKDLGKFPHFMKHMFNKEISLVWNEPKILEEQKTNDYFLRYYFFHTIAKVPVFLRRASKNLYEIKSALFMYSTTINPESTFYYAIPCNEDDMFCIMPELAYKKIVLYPDY